ncbi:MAG TPA: class I SAM-dependent methyltransferase [Alphaproteobacteria bacterium]|nr:class I SAM-dependent methyltransferase [Alphaproteobacteria bacterium]
MRALAEVRDFWNNSPCQSDLSQLAERRRYFDEISQKRYNGREWHVPLVANFPAYKGKQVLEIGCSIATDGLEFAKAGAIYTGLDLTPHSVELAEERFGIFDVPGTFVVANAEELPFPDDSFDHIYSFGVIHHAPHPEKIAAEMHRVLRKGGTFTVMLYNRTSINYYVEIMFLRKIFRLCLLPKPMPRIIAALAGFDRWKLEGHRDILRRRGHMKKDEWISINTDGPFCPLARVYNREEAGKLFKDFANVRQEVWEFNSEHWSLAGKLIPVGMERQIGRLWGWHRMIYGEKL